ncbi:glycerate kinase [Paenarthrobacter sp. NPDC090522]|uniref:glycerate kinase type-2 family protein n=1 Tax=Paenarthrobacter sp. NPDC090522 TaxID=3364383 RepID=UPI003820835D
MPKIKNRKSLLAQGDVVSRELVLDIAEATLTRLDAYNRIRSIMSLDGDTLTIGTRSWDLTLKLNIYLIGAGKACNHMAMAVDHVLGEKLTHGIAIVKLAEETDTFNRTKVFVGGHPLPNQAGFDASREILDLVDSAGPDDLFIAVISGGSSALMNYPVDGISVEDEAVATDLLLKSGAGIYEVNAVRRHISQTNGGRLAERIRSRGAELIGIGISDAVGNAPTSDIGIPYERYASTPIGPDRTTLSDARKVIVDYNLQDVLPPSITNYLNAAGPDQETPKAFPENTYFVLNTVPDLCLIAKEEAEKRDIPAYILTSYLEGESKDAGTFMASLAREIQATGNPFRAPCVVFTSGETTTFIPAVATITGHGGPGQELVTGFALSAGSVPGACMFSIDSEGTDGTSPAAGGLTDSTTAERAAASGLNLHAALRGHAAFEALTAVGDAVLTGNTGTNLCDFNILYVPAL